MSLVDDVNLVDRCWYGPVHAAVRHFRDAPPGCDPFEHLQFACRERRLALVLRRLDQLAGDEEGRCAEQLTTQTVERFGRLDVAVNNAGVETTPGPVVEQSVEAYTAAFDTNVLGTLLGMRHELRAMQPQGSGSIVNISSTMGSRGAANMSLYAGGKHAVEGMTARRRRLQTLNGVVGPHRTARVGGGES